VYAQQECFGVPGGVAADGDHHAGFGDPVVGWVFADDGVNQDVVNLLNPGLPRASNCCGVFVGILIGDAGGEQETQGVQFAV
jgi:hypothetical protein